MDGRTGYGVLGLGWPSWAGQTRRIVNVPETRFLFAHARADLLFTAARVRSEG